MMHRSGSIAPRSIRHCWIVFAIAFCSIGCSKKQLSDLADTVSEKGGDLIRESKQATDSLVNDPEPQPGPTGHFSVQLASPLEFDQATIRLFVIGDGRPQSLQIATYDTESDQLSSPSLFLVGSTSIETIPLHENQTIACDLFIAPPLNRPLLRTPIGSTVDVTFDSIDFSVGTITGIISSCTLLSSDGTSVNCNGGQFRAVIAH